MGRVNKAVVEALKNLAIIVSFCLSALLPLPVMASSTLDSPAQLERERTMLKVLAHPTMRASTARIAALYRGDPRAQSEAGKKRIARAAESISVAAIFYALGEDVTRPHVYWTTFAPHRWHGMTVPGSGFGIDNPDNIYQGFTVTGSGRYLLHGRVPNHGPVQIHMEVRDAIPGMGEMLVEGGRQLATIQTEQLKFDTEGRFTIVIDSAPADGRQNHLAIPATGNVNVGIRQLFTDWSKQLPAELRLERLNFLAPPMPHNIGEIAQRSAEILDRIGPYWLDYNNKFIYSMQANTISTPRARPGGRGLSASGHYALEPDEALVITVDTLGAQSFGIQIADPWGVAYDYDRLSSSLNNAQAQANSDGTITLIISAQDPGYPNWLDAGGYSSGIIALRWQAVPATAEKAKAVLRMTLVKSRALANSFPARQQRFSAEDRAAQRKVRARAYAFRVRR